MGSVAGASVPAEAGPSFATRPLVVGLASGTTVFTVVCGASGRTAGPGGGCMDFGSFATLGVALRSSVGAPAETSPMAAAPEAAGAAPEEVLRSSDAGTGAIVTVGGFTMGGSVPRGAMSASPAPGITGWVSPCVGWSSFKVLGRGGFGMSGCTGVPVPSAARPMRSSAVPVVVAWVF